MYICTAAQHCSTAARHLDDGWVQHTWIKGSAVCVVQSLLDVMDADNHRKKLPRSFRKLVKKVFAASKEYPNISAQLKQHPDLTEALYIYNDEDGRTVHDMQRLLRWLAGRLEADFRRRQPREYARELEHIRLLNGGEAFAGNGGGMHHLDGEEADPISHKQLALV